MAEKKQAASKKEAAKPKRVFVTVKDSEGKSKKYELLGGPNKKFIFQGGKFNKEEAAKEEKLIASLVATGSPLLEEV